MYMFFDFLIDRSFELFYIFDCSGSSRFDVDDISICSSVFFFILVFIVSKRFFVCFGISWRKGERFEVMDFSLKW